MRKIITTDATAVVPMVERFWIFLAHGAHARVMTKRLARLVEVWRVHESLLRLVDVGTTFAAEIGSWICWHALAIPACDAGSLYINLATGRTAKIVAKITWILATNSAHVWLNPPIGLSTAWFGCVNHNKKGWLLVKEGHC